MSACSFLAGGGTMGAMMRAHDWGESPLGQPEVWPQSLRSVVGLLLNSEFPMFVAWGEHLGFLYNDAYAAILGAKHPKALGAQFRDIWTEIWPDISPLIDAAMSGVSSYRENLPLLMHRKGFDEPTWFTFSYSPVRDDSGDVAGMFCVCTETTSQVLGERRREALLRLENRLRDEEDTANLSYAASELLGEALGAVRVGYGVLDAATRTISVERNWSAPGYVDVAGRHKLDNYGNYIGELMRGTPVANADIANDPRTAGFVDSFRALGIRAHLDVPVMEDGEAVAQLFVHSADPRAWSDDEIALVQEVADRTHAAIARRVAEQDQRESEARFRAIFARAAVGLSEIALDGRFISVNDELCTMLGRSRLELLSSGVAEVTHRDSLVQSADAFRQVVETGVPLSFETRHLRPDGREVRANSNLTRLDNERGRARAVLVATVDLTDRYAAQAALAASEEFNRRILASSPDCIKVLDLDGHIEFMNDGGQLIMEVDDFAAVRSAYWPDLWQGEEQGKALAAAATARKGETARLQGFARTLKGTPKWWDVVVTPIMGSDGHPEKLLSVSRDITEQRLADERVRESEGRFRLMADAVPQIVWITDAEGRVEFFNQQWSDYTGVPYEPTTAAEVAATHVHPEDAPTTVAAFDEARRTGTTFLVEHRIRAANGEYRWFLVRGEPYRDEVSGEITRWFGTSVDIHDRKLAEARLRELNDTLESQVAARSAERDRLWNLSQDMLARADFGGMMSAVSPAWTQVLGWSADELLSRGYATFMHPDDMPPTLEAIARMAETRQPTRFENRIATSDGGWKHIEWTVAPEPDGENFIAVGRDLSAAKKREEELGAAQELLRQSQKMEAMGSLTGGVAHDFNNLLTPIIGSLDLLQRKQLGGEREQRLVDGAVQSAERARLLVQRLLAFARRQPLQPRAVDVGALVSGMADLVSSTTGPQIKVVVSVADGIPAAVADPNQIEMAILNLSVNARDAMANGGTLRISAQDDRIGERHRSRLKPGRYIRLSVADDGSGMDETTLARAIEPFFSTKGVGRGTGLGLSMVHGLASQLGGALTIESRPGLGTNVEIWLPATDETARWQDPVEEPDTRLSSGKALLVDDEDLVRASTADMLIELGYIVEEASSAEEALRLIDSGHHFDLLVTDHLMPGMTGTELAREVRGRQPGARTLVVSGYADVDGLAPELPRLAKPFRRTDLAAKLSEFDGV